MSGINIVRLFFLALIMLALGHCYTARASGDCKGQSCNNGGETNVEVNNNVSFRPLNSVGANNRVDNAVSNESKSLGLSHGMGDVDINQCLGSRQWSTPLYSRQKLVINWPCMAEFYLRNGMFRQAAMALCNTEIRDEYESEAACEADHDFQAVAVGAMPDEHEDDEDEYHREMAEELAMLRADLQAKIANLEEETKKRPRSTTERVEVQKVPFLSEKQKAALREVIDE